MEQIDLAIIGSGPAGYTASIYASRYKLNNIVFGKSMGGTIADAHKVCNYPGYEEISGFDLGMKFSEQAKNLGGISKQESVEKVEKKDNGMFEITTDKDTYEAKGVILATGTKRSKLMLPGEDKYLGKGVSYCATCDAMFFREKTVAVIGGSDAATTAALLLSETSKQVYIIYRKDELRGDPTWVETVKNTPNIEVIYKTVVTGLNGNDKLESLNLSSEYKRN